jgi:hypothetical protein
MAGAWPIILGGPSVIAAGFVAAVMRNLGRVRGSSEERGMRSALDGKTFFTLKAQDDFNRDFDRGWKGISGNIDLYAHELRHLDGFPHVSCCGIDGGCDQTYDESNLSPYGIQRWLNAHWVTGEIYVGFSCLDPTQVADIMNWHLSACNSTFGSRFCDNRPPILDPPPTPGGACRPDCGDVTGEGAVNSHAPDENA